MSLIRVNVDPNTRQLRQFAVACSCLMIFGAWYWGWPTSIRWMVAAIVLGMTCLAIFRCHWLRIPFIALSLVTAPIGIVVGEGAMLILYAVGIVPLALYFRWRKRDRLQLNREPQTTTYWEEKSPKEDPESYFRPF